MLVKQNQPDNRAEVPGDLPTHWELRLTVDDVSAAARLPADGEDGEEEGEHADEGDQDDQAEHARHIALPGRVAHDGTVACVGGGEMSAIFCFLLLRLLLRCHCHTHADSSAFGTSPSPLRRRLMYVNVIELGFRIWD